MDNVIYQIEKVPENFNEMRFLPVLNEKERLRYQVITDEHRRRQFLFSRFILKNKLFEILGRNSNEIDFETNEFGKPYLPSKDRTFFNLSHSGNYVGYVIAKKEVGLDIQEARNFDNLDKLIEKTSHPNEITLINSMSDRTQAFTKLWTLKEAFSKCIGKGIQANFSSLDFSKLLYQDRFESAYIEVDGSHYEGEFSILTRATPLFVSAFKKR